MPANPNSAVISPWDLIRGMFSPRSGYDPINARRDNRPFAQGTPSSQPAERRFPWAFDSTPHDGTEEMLANNPGLAEPPIPTMETPVPPTLGAPTGMGANAAQGPSQAGMAQVSGAVQPQQANAYGGLTPDMMDAAVQLSGMGDRRELIREQIAQADALRSKPMPKGIQTQNAFVAANPLAIAGKVWSSIRGKKQGDAARSREQAMLAEILRGRGKLAEAYRGGPAARPQDDLGS